MRIRSKRAVFVLICAVMPYMVFAQTGSILREYWTGIPGMAVSALTGNANYPDNPTDTSLLTDYLEAPANWNDNYGTRIRGYVHPPVTGNYIFWIASNDSGELWLSSDDKQLHKALIASVPGYTASREWTKYPAQQSAAINLTAGQKYYIEVLHKEGTNNDNCAVGWQLPGSTYERPIPATRLSPVADDEDYSLWNDTTRIVMNTTTNGANISVNVTGFPVLVRLNESNFDFSEALPDGADLRFAKLDGTHLKYQIEQWDTLTKNAAIWVLIDTVYGNDSTRFFTMLWGNTGAVSRSNGNAVFDTTGGYRGVWHVSQNPGGTAPQMSDATLRNNHGSAQGGMTAADRVSGLIGPGVDLDGTDDYISTATQFSNPQVFTTSLWFKTTTASGGKLFGFGNLQAGSSSSYDRHIWLGDGGRVRFGVYNGSAIQIASTASYNDGVWHQMVAQLSSSGMKLWCDGVLAASNTSTTAQNYTGYWRIGYDNMASWSYLPSSFYTQAILDEITVAHVQRSDGWIKLSYENQRTGSTFLSVETPSIKPLLTVSSTVDAVPETSITYVPFTITASIGTPAAAPRTITVLLNWSGTATAGVDYLTMPASVAITIPTDSTRKVVTLSFTPVDDTLDEGNEIVRLTLLPDTSYRLDASNIDTIVLTDNDQRYPPQITLEPSDLAVMEGDVGVFMLEVSGSTPFGFVWRKNGVPITGSPNSAVYSIPPASYADSGARYSCIVTNSVSSDTSRNALLSVSIRPEAPRILRQPQAQTITEGDTAIFKAVVAGTPPFTWQWYCDTAVVSGGVDSVLRVGPLTLADNGKRYYCQITNSVAGIASNHALLTVRKPSSHTMIITGDLFTAGYDPVGFQTETPLDFTVKLYSSVNDSTVLYTETFYASDNQAVIVKDGKFALQLGAGKSADDLMETVRTNANLFVSFTIARPGGNPETLDRRVPLTASPYALSSLPQLLKGTVDPDSAALEAPIGTHFLRTTNDSTYIRTARGWVVLR